MGLSYPRGISTKKTPFWCCKPFLLGNAPALNYGDQKHPPVAGRGTAACKADWLRDGNGDHEHKENYVETNTIWLFNIAMENPL